MCRLRVTYGLVGIWTEPRVRGTGPGLPSETPVSSDGGTRGGRWRSGSLESVEPVLEEEVHKSHLGPEEEDGHPPLFVRQKGEDEVPRG